MTDMNEIIFTACCTVAAIELLSFLVGDDGAFKTVCSLAVVLLIISSFIAVAEEVNLDVDLKIEQDLLTNEMYLSEAQGILRDQVDKALASSGVYNTKTEIILSMDDNNEVSVEVLKIGVKYSADIERAGIVAENMFSGMVKTEVYLTDD